jgi:haloalkane dehalogenase
MAHSSWVNRTEYPFQSHYFAADMGRMHYVDEGQGRPILMVHGTPTWSFLYRDLIKGLSKSHRVIAMDHIGFGLSDKPEGWTYRPEDHARNLAALVRHLGLEDFTLVVHDFGGPIGLAYALEHPEDVRDLVLFNTWMWPLEDNPGAVRGSKLMGGAMGRFLYRRLNLSPKQLIPAAMGDRSTLTKEAHRHYIDAFPRPEDRPAPWVFARELIGSSGWYDSLWQRRARIQEKPALLLWGMKDPTFGPEYLERWKQVLPRAVSREFPDAGHFVQEEEGERLVPVIERFLTRS